MQKVKDMVTGLEKHQAFSVYFSTVTQQWFSGNMLVSISKVTLMSTLEVTVMDDRLSV